jgi:hypothetical protein
MNGKSHKKRKQERKYLRMKPKKNELKKQKQKVNSDEPSKLRLISKTQNPLNSIVRLNEEAQYSKNLMLNDEIN